MKKIPQGGNIVLECFWNVLDSFFIKVVHLTWAVFAWTVFAKHFSQRRHHCTTKAQTGSTSLTGQEGYFGKIINGNDAWERSQSHAENH